LLIYLWVKKGDRHKDIVLYSIYAAILGFIIAFIMGFFQIIPFIHAKTFFNSVIFMLSVAVMMIYFQETRKIGTIFLILGIIGSFMTAIYGTYSILDVLELLGVSIISTLIIYAIKEKLVSLNQIFRLMYIILK